MARVREVGEISPTPARRAPELTTGSDRIVQHCRDQCETAIEPRSISLAA
jgi:hypothetical protein